MAVCVGLFLAFDLTQFTARLNLIAVSVLVLMFWMASASLVYLFEKAFDEPSMGQLVVLCGNSLIGLLTLMISLILQLLWWIPVIFCILLITVKNIISPKRDAP